MCGANRFRASHRCTPGGTHSSRPPVEHRPPSHGRPQNQARSSSSPCSDPACARISPRGGSRSAPDRPRRLLVVRRRQRLDRGGRLRQRAHRNAAVQPDLGHDRVLSDRWLPLLRRHRRLRPGSGLGAAADHGRSHALGLDQAHGRAKRPVRRQQAVRVRARPRPGHGALSADAGRTRSRAGHSSPATWQRRPRATSGSTSFSSATAPRVRSGATRTAPSR